MGVGEFGTEGELKNGLSEKREEDVPVLLMGWDGGALDIKGEAKDAEAFGKTGLAQRLQVISCAGVLVALITVLEDVGSIMSSPAMIAAPTLRRLSQLRSGAMSSLRHGSWSSVTALARKG